MQPFFVYRSLHIGNNIIGIRASCKSRFQSQLRFENLTPKPPAPKMAVHFRQHQAGRQTAAWSSLERKGEPEIHRRYVFRLRLKNHAVNHI